MALLDQLALIERLVIEKATPAEIRGHLQAMHEQLEAYDAKQAETTVKQTALEMTNSALVAKNEELVAAYAALNAKHTKLVEENAASKQPVSGIAFGGSKVYDMTTD